MNRTKTKNDFMRGFSAQNHFLVLEFNSLGPKATEQHSPRQRAGEHGNVSPVHERIDIGPEDRPSFSVANGFIDKRASSCRLHHTAIHAGKAWQPDRFSAVQEGEGKRLGIRRGLDMHHSARAAKVRIWFSSPRLDTIAVKVKNGVISPGSIIRFGSVKIPIGLVSPRPRRNVYAGAATKDLAH